MYGPWSTMRGARPTTGSISTISGMKGSINLALLLALIPLLAEAAPQLTITELMQMLGSVESASAKFVETRHSALLKSPLVLQGTLAYRRPDRLEKHVLSPYDERITVEGSRLSLE